MPKIPPGLEFTAPPAPPKGWEERWKLKDRLNRQNPMLFILGGKTYLANDRTLGKEVKLDDDDEKKKEKRKREIMAANRKKRKSTGSKTSIASGTGTVTPILYSYPSSYPAESTAGGFSLSDVPSIVWIVLAVAAGVFLIKSARKR